MFRKPAEENIMKAIRIESDDLDTVLAWITHLGNLQSLYYSVLRVVSVKTNNCRPLTSMEKLDVKHILLNANTVCFLSDHTSVIT